MLSSMVVTDSTMTCFVCVTGSAGRSIELIANYFKLGSVTDWIVNQYRVDFAPDVDHVGVRKGLLRDHKAILGGYVFDGSVLFCCHRFPTDPLEVFSTKRNQAEAEPIRISIRFTKQLLQGDSQYLQLFNIIMRKCLTALDLQLVGRNHFDAKASVSK
jgi:aubergine-like protein